MSQFKPTRFEILPPVIKNLIIINALVFLAQSLLGEKFNLSATFALHTWQSPLFKPLQLFTHMFMHGDFFHLLSNMFALWMFGSVLENVWGQKKFLQFYLICGLGAALCHMLALYYETQKFINFYNQLSPIQQPSYEEQYLKHLYSPTVGASGAVFGCLAAFGFLFPNTIIYVEFFIPVKAKWFVAFYAAFELFSAVRHSAGDNVAHIAHLGGALFGFLLVYFWNKTNKKTFY